MSRDKLDELVNSIASLSLLEAKEFSEAMVEKLGVRPLPVAPTIYDYRNVPGGMPFISDVPGMYALRVKSFGPNRVPVMAFLRDRFNYGLVEAKKVVDAGEALFERAGDRVQVQALIEDLRRLGAVATLEVDTNWY